MGIAKTTARGTDDPSTTVPSAIAVPLSPCPCHGRSSAWAGEQVRVLKRTCNTLQHNPPSSRPALLGSEGCRICSQIQHLSTLMFSTTEVSRPCQRCHGNEEGIPSDLRQNNCNVKPLAYQVRQSTATTHGYTRKDWCSPPRQQTTSSLPPWAQSHWRQNNKWAMHPENIEPTRRQAVE